VGAAELETISRTPGVRHSPAIDRKQDLGALGYTVTAIDGRGRRGRVLMMGWVAETAWIVLRVCH